MEWDHVAKPSMLDHDVMVDGVDDSEPIKFLIRMLWDIR